MAEDFVLGGDPGSISASGRTWGEFSTSASSASGSIKSVQAGAVQGDEWKAFTDDINDKLPGHLDTTSEAWGIVSRALISYADKLTGFQQRMASLKSTYDSQQTTAANAKASLDAAHRNDQAEKTRMTTATAALKPGQTLPPSNYVSPTSGAQSSFTEANGNLQATLAAANKVRSEHADALQACVSDVNRAKGMRFQKPPGWFGSMMHSVGNWIKDHADVLTKISGILKTVAGICGVLAFIPVVGEFFGAVALVAGGLALGIDVTLKLVTGQGSWTQIGLDALSMVPGARAAKLAYGANVAYTGYNVATGKASITDLAMTAGVGALGLKGGSKDEKFGGGRDGNGPTNFEGPKRGNNSGEPQFIGMPTHVSTLNANGQIRNRVVMPSRTGETVTVPSGTGGSTATTVTRTSNGYHVTVDNGGSNALNTHLAEGSDIHFGDGSVPAPNGTMARPTLVTTRSTRPYAQPHGVRVSENSAQNGMANQMRIDMETANMGTRVDQAQVSSNGNHYPSNRPDVSGNLNGTQPVHAEYDRVSSNGGQGARVPGHVDGLLSNDPSGIIFTIPSP